MPLYEYKVVPAPRRGVKLRSLKTTPERFAHAVAEVMNRLGAEGWEYQRSEALPCEERKGLTGRVTQSHDLLVFRREIQMAERPVIHATPGPDVGLRSATASFSATRTTPPLRAEPGLKGDDGDLAAG